MVAFQASSSNHFAFVVALTRPRVLIYRYLRRLALHFFVDKSTPLRLH
jgi:hypothetical protein